VHSVLHAAEGLACEVFVVDNASTDGSSAYLQQNLPDHVKLICSPENLGFAKANNMALAKASGKYTLFLNPDTLVPEDCLNKCLQKLEEDSNIGALGVHLVDGTGSYLPESKRGFPDFATAFYRIVGLSKLFPTSQKYSKYYMGQIPPTQSSIVDVLVGCFMMMPTQLAKELGGFDEDYFMYGEDIDLSYKVQKAGKQNYYLADVSAIHFKGESTKKDSMKYVRMFYNAMIVFAQKHLSSSGKNSYVQLIKCAIAARASVDFISRGIGKLLLPICDALLMLLALWQTKNYWLQYIKPDTDYTTEVLAIFFSSYIVIWLLSIFVNGGYDTPLRKSNIIRGMAIGALVTVAVYGLLPEHVRFSRGVTVVGALLSMALIWLLRYLLQWLNVAKVAGHDASRVRMLSVSNGAQSEEGISTILKRIGIHNDWLGNINASAQASQSDLGNLQQLKQLAEVHRAQEIIFALPDISYQSMISFMKEHATAYRYKMFVQNIPSIIGSNSKNTAGDYYASDEHFAIAQAAGIRSKRSFDITIALVLLLSAPLSYMLIKNKQVFSSLFTVLIGKHTWIGYSSNAQQLPRIKPAVFAIADSALHNATSINMLNTEYAKMYNWRMDLSKFLQVLRTK
jgi:GT2 family glycosyltransferase